MTFPRFAMTLALGLAAAACTSTVRTETVTAPPALTGSQQVCLDYGFTPGTMPMTAASPESTCPRPGRALRGYAEAS